MKSTTMYRTVHHLPSPMFYIPNLKLVYPIRLLDALENIICRPAIQKPRATGRRERLAFMSCLLYPHIRILLLLMLTVRTLYGTTQTRARQKWNIITESKHPHSIKDRAKRAPKTRAQNRPPLGLGHIISVVAVVLVFACRHREK